MKVLFITDCIDCPYSSDDYSYCKYLGSEYNPSIIPDSGIRIDCPLDELGKVDIKA